jgi:hypothetical protein
MERRKFFGALSAGASGFSAALRSRTAGRNFLGEIQGEKLPRRPLGRTGENLSIIGLGGLVLADETQEAGLSLRFTLSQPVTSAVPPGDVRLFKRALELAHGFTPLQPDDETRLRQLAGNLNPLFTLHSA